MLGLRKDTVQSPPTSRLGELLIRQKLITREQLEEALSYQRNNGGRLGACLVTLGHTTEADITAILSRQYGIPSIDLTYFELDPEIIKLLARDVAYKYQVVPLSRVGSALSVAMADPNNVFVLDELKFMRFATRLRRSADRSTCCDPISSSRHTRRSLSTSFRAKQSG